MRYLWLSSNQIEGSIPSEIMELTSLQQLFMSHNNLSGFIENRHDQSIFSLICKKYGVKTLSAFEIDWAYLGKKRTWEHNKNCPILLKRDLKYNLLKRFLNRQKKTYKRIIKKVSSI